MLILSKSKAATKIFFWAENLITPSFVRPVLRPLSRNAPSPRLLPIRAPAQPLHAWLDPLAPLNLRQAFSPASYT